MTKVFGQQPAHPAKLDQLIARFTDRAHQCTVQSAAVTNNTALLAFVISRKVEEAELPEELKGFLCKAADAILNICATSEEVCSSRIAAWQTMVQRATWLRLFPPRLYNLTGK